MRPDSLLSTLAHHVQHAAAISGAVVAMATIAFGLELFRHLLRYLGASDELLTPLGWLIHTLVYLDLALIAAMAAKGAGQALRRLFAD